MQFAVSNSTSEIITPVFKTKTQIFRQVFHAVNFPVNIRLGVFRLFLPVKPTAVCLIGIEYRAKHFPFTGRLCPVCSAFCFQHFEFSKEDDER